MKGQYNVYLNGRRLGANLVPVTTRNAPPTANSVCEAVQKIKMAKKKYRVGKAWHDDDYISAATTMGSFNLHPPAFRLPPEVRENARKAREAAREATDAAIKESGFLNVYKGIESCRTQRFDCKLSNNMVPNWRSKRFRVHVMDNHKMSIEWMGDVNNEARTLSRSNTFTFFTDYDVITGRYVVESVNPDYIVLKHFQFNHEEE